MLLWCSSFPMASFLPRSQRQAGHTYSLTPAGVKTLENRKKIFIRGFHRVSSGFPALLQRGNVHQAKDMRRSLKLSKVPVKIFCPVETYARARHSSGPLYTHFLMCFSQGSVPTAPETQHKPYSPTQTPHVARGAAAAPPNLSTCNRHLCADLSPFVPRTRGSIYPWKDWEQHSCLSKRPRISQL